MLTTKTEKSARVYCHIKVVKCCKIQNRGVFVME